MTAPFEQPAEAVQAPPERTPDEFRAWAASRRRSIGGWLLLFVGWLGGSVALALDLEDTRHLLDRVAFGPTPAWVAALAPLSREEAVDHLLQAPAPPPPAPAWARERPFPDRRPLATRSDAERRAWIRTWNQERHDRRQHVQSAYRNRRKRWAVADLFD